VKIVYKNPKVTPKDIRKGKIFWTYPYDTSMDMDGKVALLCIKVLEDYRKPTQNSSSPDWKPWVAVEVLSDPSLTDIHTSTYLRNKSKGQAAPLIIFVEDKLISSNSASLYSTPTAAYNNAVKKINS